MIRSRETDLTQLRAHATNKWWCHFLGQRTGIAGYLRSCRACSDAALNLRGRKEPTTDRSGQLLAANAIMSVLRPDAYDRVGRRAVCRSSAVRQPATVGGATVATSGRPGLQGSTSFQSWELAESLCALSPLAPLLQQHPVAQALGQQSLSS